MRNHLAMAQRKAEVGDAGVEVIAEALHDRGQLPLVGGHEVVAQYGRERGRGCRVAPARPPGDRTCGAGREPIRRINGRHMLRVLLM